MPTRFQVDLDAINENLAAARDLAGGRKVLAAVKANAYGHGIVPVALSIQEHGSADWLGVATTQEGTALRAGGVTLPVLKFTPTLPDDLAEAIAADVTLAIGSADEARSADAAAEEAGSAVDVHVAVDTGMRRVGAPWQEIRALAEVLHGCAHLRVTGVFTHLPVSDVASGYDFTREQFGRFEQAVDALESVVGPVELVHAANSGGVLGHDLGRTTMVRPGVMIYGSYPDPTTEHTRQLREVGRWTTRITFVKPIAEGDTVGYGRTWTAPRDTWLATAAVGYGDGFSRLNSSRGRVLIDGKSYPIVGRVCMDQIMVDLGPVRPDIAVGDEVVLMGKSGDEHIGVDELAELMGTISYEVTCLITERVPRDYV